MHYIMKLKYSKVVLIIAILRLFFIFFPNIFVKKNIAKVYSRPTVI